jgi:hypothetical protein
VSSKRFLSLAPFSGEPPASAENALQVAMRDAHTRKRRKDVIRGAILG